MTASRCGPFRPVSSASGSSLRAGGRFGGASCDRRRCLLDRRRAEGELRVFREGSHRRRQVYAAPPTRIFQPTGAQSSCHPEVVALTSIDPAGWVGWLPHNPTGRPNTMDHPRRRGWAVLRHLAAPALALAVVATLPMTRSGDAPAAAAEYAPGLAPASVSYGLPAGRDRQGPVPQLQRLPRRDRPARGQRRRRERHPGRRCRIPGHLAEEAARRGRRRGPQDAHRRRRRPDRRVPAGQRRVPRRADDRADERDRAAGQLGRQPRVRRGRRRAAAHSARRLPPDGRLPGRRPRTAAPTSTTSRPTRSARRPACRSCRRSTSSSSRAYRWASWV